ncbi:hypothetical protein Tco_1243325 [Tanacetum coccineum]
MNERKKHFARLRAEEQRRKLLTKDQKRNQMSNYLKNMAGYTLQQLRGYSFNEIKTLFKTTMRKVNTFVLIESEGDKAIPELAAGSSKRDAKEELDQESSKRQKTGESLELAEELRDREANELDDLVELKRLFEPDTDDELWKLQKHIHDLTWRLYDSCGVHHVSTEKGIDIYMLVEKEYPLSRGTLTLMLVAKLLVDQDNEMSRELLRKIFMQDQQELLMKCPQHYLTEMHEVVLFYNGLDVPTRQILNSRGAIPSKTTADAKVSIQEWLNSLKNGTTGHPELEVLRLLTD